MYRPRDQSVCNKIIKYESRTREMLDQIAAGSGRHKWAEYLSLYGIVHEEAKKLRSRVTHMREHSTRAVLAAYTGSEQQSYRPPTKMKT